MPPITFIIVPFGFLRVFVVVAFQHNFVINIIYAYSAIYNLFFCFFFNCYVFVFFFVLQAITQ